MTPDTPATPAFSELTEAQCEALLGRHHVGRLAFTFRDRVDIEPIHYVYEDGFLVFRTAVGIKLEILTHHPWAALEVDEIEGVFDWRSVVVHGSVYPVDAVDDEESRAAYTRAVDLLRRVVPQAFTAEDPVPHRAIVLQLHVDRMTGRSSTTMPARA